MSIGIRKLENSATSNRTDSWTVRTVLDWTTEHLRRSGSETPRLDAEILLAHSRSCPRIELYTRYDEPLSDLERSIMRELVQRRAQSEPVAYLVGYREFYSLEFRVNPGVLIPRPETELLVMESLDLLKLARVPRVLDLGTGSGCVAVSIAANHVEAQITACDISEAAIEVAAENAERHGLTDRIEFRSGNLFDALDSDSLFDLIVSNPPYVAESELDLLDKDVRCHEPRLALDGGRHGLVILKRIIENGGDWLVPGGHLLLEIAPEQAKPIESLVLTTNRFGPVHIINDLSGNARAIRICKNG